VRSDRKHAPAPALLEGISRYHIMERSQGFRIEGGLDRIPVDVHLNGTHWTVRDALEDDEEKFVYPYSIGLYNFRSLVRTIANRLMGMWHPDENTLVWGGIYDWAIAQTSHAICTRVRDQWQRLLVTLPEAVRRVTRRVFAATFNSYDLGCETWDALYTGEYAQLIQDIVKFPAAAIACHCATRLGVNVAQSLRIQREFSKQGSLPGSTEDRFGTIYKRTWTDPFVEKDQDAEIALARRSRTARLASDWKAFFSYTGTAYRSLNRTLMALPGAIPYGLLCSFPYARPERPVTDRVELLALLFFCEQLGLYRYQDKEGRYEERPVAEHWAYSLFSKATREGIARALHRYDAHMHREPRALTASSIYDLVRFICLHCAQLPAASKQNVVGLTELAIEKHNEQFQQMLAEAIEHVDANAYLAIPPIEPPVNPVIRLLRTAAEVVQEGWHMGHCIPMYVDEAIRGQAYLFHVTYQGEEASAMVSAQGHVVMCQGPRSRTNGASAYGIRILSRWAKGLCQALIEPECSPELDAINEDMVREVVV
jgi:hypothetical protein